MEKGDIALIYVKDKTSASGENVSSVNHRPSKSFGASISFFFALLLFLKAGSRYQGMSFKRLAPKGENLTA